MNRDKIASNSLNTAPCSENAAQDVSDPPTLLGWEWLDRPAMLVTALGVAGLLLSWAGQTVQRLFFFRFPPPWACCILVLGGLSLWVIAVCAEQARRDYRPQSDPSPKSWRNF
ncbi:MAG TPA: hypothetical protein ENN97_08840 [Phycisphaerales bacterium]|nr:hypothetical protein [Phycisphaerales bacterium]